MRGIWYPSTLWPGSRYALVRRRMRVALWFFVWAAVGAVITAGPLGGGVSWYTLAGGLGTGTVMAFLVSRAASDRRNARLWRRRFVWPARLVLVYLAAILVLQLDATGALPVFWGGYAYHYDRLAAALSAHSPYLGTLDEEWDVLRQAYREKAAAAATDEEFLQVVAELLARFGDGHARVTGPAAPHGDVLVVGDVTQVGGAYVITRVAGGLPAAGLEPGAVILERDGLPAAAYIAQLAPWHGSGASPQSRQQRRLQHLLAVPEGGTATLTVRTVAGTTVEVTVPGDAALAELARNTAPPVRAERLPSGIGYIAVTSFAEGRAADLFAQAVDALLDAPALIIDVRQAAGGELTAAERAAGRFLAEPFTYARLEFRHRLPHFLWIRENELTVLPADELYHGPVVVLAGPGTQHAAEAFLVAMRDSGRAAVVGEPTAGEVSVPIAFFLPGGKAEFSVGAFIPAAGPQVAGVGVQPDIWASPAYEDIVSGHDAVLQAAVEYLLSRNR